MVPFQWRKLKPKLLPVTVCKHLREVITAREFFGREEKEVEKKYPQ